eukprot:363925-Chlamydomonas_euryale.AAC.5
MPPPAQCHPLLHATAPPHATSRCMPSPAACHLLLQGTLPKTLREQHAKEGAAADAARAQASAKTGASRLRMNEGVANFALHRAWAREFTDVARSGKRRVGYLG